jgi:hypothetical protein
MKRPFKIFPSIGYRNSQFQVVSSIENLKVDIYKEGELIKSIEVNSNYPTLLTSLNEAGKHTAICSVGKYSFQQEIEVKDAFRFGSSEFKKSFLFDDTDYSFFLMKDRLLLYDEKKKILLTENYYSPSEIHKVNKNSFLFVTKFGDSINGIVNLGIYNIENFSIVAELLNDYQEIKILPEINKVWTYNIRTRKIHCHEISNQTNKYFSELKSFENFNDFFIDERHQNLYIEYSDSVKVFNLINLNESLEVSKKNNNAIDKSGNLFSIENNKLYCTRILSNYKEVVNIDFDINLCDENFIHIGNELKIKDKLQDLNVLVQEIKDEIFHSLPVSNSYFYFDLPENQRLSESFTKNKIYSTRGGYFLIQEQGERCFNGIAFKKKQNIWNAEEYTTKNSHFFVYFLAHDRFEILVDKSSYLIVSDYLDSIITVYKDSNQIVLSGNDSLIFNKEDSIKLFTINEIGYVLIERNGKYSLFRSDNLNEVILKDIEILNPELLEKHKILWYRGKCKNTSNSDYLKAFNLENCTTLFIDNQIFKQLIFKGTFDFAFFEKYAISPNKHVFNPVSLEVKDVFEGIIESQSEKLNKISSYRNKNIYLSLYNHENNKYELTQISFEDKSFNESYLSPNGQFLVLNDDNDKYSFYDIEKNKVINFFSGNFLAFRNDGSLIIEENNSRAAKIIDPKSFKDITPPNYIYYRFLSPDGKLYAQVSSKTRYYHKLSGIELTSEDVRNYRKDLDEPSLFLDFKEREQEKIIIKNNKKRIFETYKSKFNELNINDYKQINSSTIVKVRKYTEIGIVGTNVLTEIEFPEDLSFYNYSAFSFDNKYFGYVGKPSSRGLIQLFKIDFNEFNSTLKVKDTYLSRYPKNATWVCGFSKTGYFATYDSAPNTFLINISENLFSNKTTETDLKENLYKSKSNIYNSYGKWNEIKGKNFLCFSPSGNFLALSEQGYEPLTLGGYGHQESNVVQIAHTATGKVVDSFTGHGDKIKENIQKKVTFVAFSEDESRIMTLSSDGVVIIRNIEINNFKDIDGKSNKNIASTEI